MPRTIKRPTFEQLPDWIGACDLAPYLRISKKLALKLIHANNPRKFGRRILTAKVNFRPGGEA